MLKELKEVLSKRKTQTVEVEKTHHQDSDSNGELFYHFHCHSSYKDDRRDPQSLTKPALSHTGNVDLVLALTHTYTQGCTYTHTNMYVSHITYTEHGQCVYHTWIVKGKGLFFRAQVECHSLIINDCRDG